MLHLQHLEIDMFFSLLPFQRSSPIYRDAGGRVHYY